MPSCRGRVGYRGDRVIEQARLCQLETGRFRRQGPGTGLRAGLRRKVNAGRLPADGHGVRFVLTFQERRLCGVGLARQAKDHRGPGRTRAMTWLAAEAKGLKTRALDR